MQLAATVLSTYQHEKLTFKKHKYTYFMIDRQTDKTRVVSFIDSKKLDNKG